MQKRRTVGRNGRRRRVHGVLGQHICVSPGARVVIVRLSKRFPQGMGWAPVFRQLALKAS